MDGLEITDTIYTARSASYLDVHILLDNEDLLRTKLQDKRDDIKCSIVNFPSICSNMLGAPVDVLDLRVGKIVQSLCFLSR